ncbi:MULTISPECIES: protease pro-enzyme activation domain-containing protein [unclassified Bacillus (in: firmicutes)]|uniref:S53 family peptidase n=1 Tax=unclassified Bacillus (in: firmicutes) TaxID=185979 RepID=UPI000BEFAC57|nr:MULTISPECIES: S53 family peptidase [unclassified Bacillus (in: firmicutes)]PEJ57208.1 peptidase S53 [Bacillus sp. AFS002410]PEL13811.1 peptidase S53 [Bacillus sp. AFS017336]
MKNWKIPLMSVAAASSLLFINTPTSKVAAAVNQEVAQGTGAAVLDGTNYFGDMDPNTTLSIDFVMKLQNKAELEKFIKETTTPYSPHYRNYLNVNEFKAKYAPNPAYIHSVTSYLQGFGLKTDVHANNLTITATGTVAQLNKALNVELKYASFKGKRIHATKKNPTLPKVISDNILCVLGLNNYSNLESRAVKQPTVIDKKDVPAGPLSLTPQDLQNHYNVDPLYKKGATGAGQTLGIVTLAEFNTDDAYKFWDNMGIQTKPNRIKVTDVDGGSGWDGYEETTLDVQQSGAIAPQANINVYVGPNSDTGFVDAFSNAINDNVAKQISVSWGSSELSIDSYVQQQMEAPEYEETFNQLFMQAAAQGISMFASAGDAGAYDETRGDNKVFKLTADFPAASPYITAAGGTTLPFQFHSTSTGLDVKVNEERAWGWDYLHDYFKARNIDDVNLVNGGGGGFSTYFDTPDYQKGVSGVNKYTAVDEFKISSDLSSVTYKNPTIITGKDSGRNIPDVSMAADPYTGYYVYLSDPGQPGTNSGYAVYGGTSLVSPQLNGLTALINSAEHTQVGFWNPQIYRFAQENSSPFTPLNKAGDKNDNLFYSGTPGTLYNQATGLGIPDAAKLADKFGSPNK